MRTCGTKSINFQIVKRTCLDLIFSANIPDVTVSISNELIDRNSTHHNDLQIEIVFTTEAIEAVEYTQNSFNIKLKNSKIELLHTNFDLINPADILETLYESPSTFENKLETITAKLLSIQSNNTSRTRSKILKDVSTHPWTKNNKYKELFQIKIKAKSEFNKSSTDLNKANLQLTYANLYHQYNYLKSAYYSKILTNNGNNHREFYKIMKSKRKTSSKFPVAMSYKNIKYHGLIKYHYIWKHLQSCYIQSRFIFASSNENFIEQISDVCRIHANYDIHNIWDEYLKWFTLG